MFTKFKKWHKDPLIVPRSLLTAKYVAFAILAILVFAWGLPTIDLLTFQGYTALWALGLFGASAWGAVYSVSETGEQREKAGAVGVFALVGAWALLAMGRALFGPEGPELDRIAGAWAVVIVSMFPGARAFGLLRGATH